MTEPPPQKPSSQPGLSLNKRSVAVALFSSECETSDTEGKGTVCFLLVLFVFVFT